MRLSQHTEGKLMDRPTPADGLSALTDDAERNRLLAEMAERSTDMISRHTPGDWRFIYASPAVTPLLGYSVEEIVGVSAHDLYHPDDVEDFAHRAESVSYAKGLYTHTYRFRCKDGHYTWLESTSRTIRDVQTGELRETLVVSRDASRRIEAEQANRRLARVLESSSDLVVFVAPDLNITQLNESARKALSLTQGALDSLVLADLLPQSCYTQLLEDGFVTANATGSWTGELDLSVARSGASMGDVPLLIPVALELLAHRPLQGPVEYYSIVARDLREPRAVEAKLKQYQADIDHAARLITMGELASSLAHELNQPLTAIVNYVRGIQRRFKDSRSVSWDELQFPLDKTAATALRAGEIIHRMMDFTRKREPSREALSVAAMIPDLIQLCRPNAERHHVLLQNRVDPALPLVLADRVQLEQILLNLLVNAIEASEQASESVPLRVSVEARLGTRAEGTADGMLWIRVKDQGQGLPAGVPQQVFERFFTTKAKGLGMGLAISRSLVENLGGQLWAENNPEDGACFCFSLPLVEGTANPS
ncbi:MAG: two-component system sensor kinase FixL [Motiliproteus sp.]|jgi:two-component system sensor kinase FixL